jgi:hypothetical protein
MPPLLLLRLVEILIAIGVGVQAIENVASYRLYARGGLYDWRVLSTTARWMRFGFPGRIFSVLFEYPVFMALIVMQLIAAVLLITDLLPNSSGLLLGTMLGGHMLFILRNQYGMDGSDQMMLIVLVSVFAFRLHPTERMLTIVFAFLTAQLVLSYLTAGIAKASSPVWRGGDAVKGILNTTSYGSRGLSKLLFDHKGISLFSCWCVILYECVGPSAIWFGHDMCLAFIACGLFFHFSIAMFMGLNIFFWSFIATYPAVYYCASHWALFGSR